MHTLYFACEVMRPELEALSQELPCFPQIMFLDQTLHQAPEQLRETIQHIIDEKEKENEELLTIITGYGLCGRALSGVHAQRATIIMPRVHDCIPLILGCSQKVMNNLSRDGAIFWISPGMFNFHRSMFKRRDMYIKKYGPQKAAKLLKAEYAMYAQYKNACYIRWPEMGGKYDEEAEQIARDLQLPVDSIQGNSNYIKQLFNGGKNHEFFLHLYPGQTIDMDVDGTIIARDMP